MVLFGRRCFFVLGLLPVFLSAQAEQKTLVQVNPVSVSNISDADSEMFETLVNSYLSSMNNIELIRQGQNTGRPVDFVLESEFGTSNDDEGIFVSFNVKDAKTGETASYRTTHRSSAEAALKLRAIVQTLNFADSDSSGGRVPALSAADAAGTPLAGLTRAEFDAALEITPRGILGLWRGGDGIEMVHFKNDGTAVAFWTSGENMNLSWSISGKSLLLTQTSPNREGFLAGYPQNIPAAAARSFENEAEPIRFALFLVDRTTLRGEKTGSEPLMDGDDFVLLHGVKRDARWTRLGR
jgi:hypothetical protein